MRRALLILAPRCCNDRLSSPLAPQSRLLLFLFATACRSCIHCAATRPISQSTPLPDGPAARILEITLRHACACHHPLRSLPPLIPSLAIVLTGLFDALTAIHKPKCLIFKTLSCFVIAQSLGRARARSSGGIKTMIEHLDCDFYESKTIIDKSIARPRARTCCADRS